MPQGDVSRKPPTYSHFNNPLVKVLGLRTNFETGAYVFNRDVYDDIIREAGFDPDNLTAYGFEADGWRRKGRSPAGLERNVSLCFRFMRKRPKKGSSPFVVQGDKKGQWGLTPEGIQRSLELNDLAPKVGQNLTAAFLEELFGKGNLLTSPAYQILCQAVSSHLPVSARSARVEDHVQQYLMRAIQRDSLRSRILSGKIPRLSHIRTFAVRSAYTDCRDDARNPVNRELYGARTRKELAEQKQGKTPITDSRISWDHNDGVTTMRDIEDTTTLTPEDMMAFEETWEVLTDVLEEEMPVAGVRYGGVLKMRLEGHTVKEIGEMESVSRHRAATILSEGRKRLRAARENGLLDDVGL